MDRYKQTWRDQQQPRKLYPPIPLHRGFAYQPAATHSDSTAFRQRQQERMRALQQGRA